MESTTMSPPRRRAPAYGRAERISASKIALEAQRKLSSWHGRVAHLRGQIACRREPSRVRAEASELASLVLAAQIEFEAACAGADEKVASNSLLRDVARAFGGLRETLETLSAGQLS
jgi:hypothetical protein